MKILNEKSLKNTNTLEKQQKQAEQKKKAWNKSFNYEIISQDGT